LLVRQQAKSLHAGDRKINGKPETGWRYTTGERRIKTEAETRPVVVQQSQSRRAEAFGAEVVGQALENHDTQAAKTGDETESRQRIVRASRRKKKMSAGRAGVTKCGRLAPVQ
jgi:hypothetical protein